MSAKHNMRLEAVSNILSIRVLFEFNVALSCNSLKLSSRNSNLEILYLCDVSATAYNFYSTGAGTGIVIFTIRCNCGASAVYL